MVVRFTDLLGSLRSDGKLIISTVIRAAMGKKIVQDVRDSADSVEFDLEDASGARTVATIPKTGGVGGADQIARDAATAAQTAADAAQTEIDEHEANHPGGGDTDAASRTSIYLDAADRAQATVHSGTLDEAVVDGYDLEFVFLEPGADGARLAYARLSSDEFLLGAAQAAAPTTTAAAMGLMVRQIDVTGLTSGAVDQFYLWLGAASDEFYYSTRQGGDFRLQVYKQIAGGPPGQRGLPGEDATNVDQTARDAAAAAQDDADTAQATADLAEENAFVTAEVSSTGFTLGRTAGNPEVEVDLSELIGTPTEQRVLNQDPNADATTLGKLQIDPQGNAYTTEPDTEHGTAQEADFGRFTHADYIGELSGEPNPLAQTLGTYYFLIVDHKLQVTETNALGQLSWEDADWSDLLVAGAGFRGARANDAAALPHIRQNGDVFFDRHSNHIRVASNFVAGVTEHSSYESKRLARIEEVPEFDPLFVERSTLPTVTDDSPDLVYLSHGHSVGVRADAVISVGFSPAGVAGYASGEISGILGSINTPSPLAEVFGLGSAADYLLESVYWLNRADLEEFVAVWLNNVYAMCLA